MEHFLHFFGGGCGEHLFLPGLMLAVSSLWMGIEMKFCVKKRREKRESNNEHDCNHSDRD